jgi:hypothetical protein
LNPRDLPEPEKLEIFSCSFCGFESVKVTECQNCVGAHLHTKDMAIGRIERPGNEEFCYDQQSIWPSFIYVKCTTRSIDGAVYQLVSRRPKSRAGVAKV